jgi:ribosomal protein S18 acetylase RimI-like enzyme
VAGAASLTIAEAAEADLAAVRGLFLEYQSELGIDLCFQGFAEEVDGLPGVYAPPGGRLLVVRVAAEVTGCVGLRPLDGRTCEMKRLYLRPAARGSGAGRQLAGRALAAARELGYERMRLDTLPAMGAAQSLYESLGFVEIEPYYDNPVPGARFLELEL